MYLFGEEWSRGYLDAWKRPKEVRIRPTAWCVRSEISNQYFQRRKNPRILLDYVREWGLRTALDKVRSRLREARRNSKFLSIGVGHVVDSDDVGTFAESNSVFFLAYNHPRCCDLVCVDRRFVMFARRVERRTPQLDFYVEMDGSSSCSCYAGWSPESGNEPDVAELRKRLEAELDEFERIRGRTPHVQLPLDRERITATTGGRLPRITRPRQRTAALVGLGNYAKTAIIPHISADIVLRRVYELDPLQIGPVDRATCLHSTSAPRNFEDDIVFVAGYHHTHADLAVEAIEQSRDVVVEKPLATTSQQLERLEQALCATNARLFTCFQRRFSVFNDYIGEDLCAGPMLYSASVYEVPLPERHWYRWPVSRSSLTSNGCHWIDHFCFLNRYSEPVRFAVTSLGQRGVQVSAELENGSALSLTLTHEGSPRLGVRDHVEIRVADSHAVITDNAKYVSERGGKRLRTKRVCRIDSYTRMYQEICRRIMAHSPGDSLRSLSSTRLTLSLEEALAASL